MIASAQSALGLIAFLVIAWSMSEQRRKVPWRKKNKDYEDYDD